MNFVTKSSSKRILVWLMWFIALLVFSQLASVGTVKESHANPLWGVVSHQAEKGSLFPWQPRYRWKKLALKQYRAWRRVFLII